MAKSLIYLSLVFASLFALEVLLRTYGYTPFIYFDYKERIHGIQSFRMETKEGIHISIQR